MMKAFVIIVSATALYVRLVFSLKCVSMHCIQGDLYRQHRWRRTVVDNKTSLKIPIGAIYGSQDQQIRSAIKLEYGQFNSKPEHMFKLKLQENFTDVSDGFKLVNAMCSQMSQGVFLFLGVKNLRSMDILDAYSRKFHIPYVSPSLAPVADANSFQIHMKPINTFAIVDMIKFYRWDVLYYLYDSYEGLQRFYTIYSILHGDETLVINLTALRLSDVTNAHEDLRRIDRNHEHIGYHKNIILDLSTHSAYVKIMEQIAEVGMNKEGYFYILTGLDFSKLDFTRFLQGGVNLTGFDIINPKRPKVRTFLKKWRTANPHIYPAAGEPLMSESAMAVDGLEAITSALEIMVKQNTSVFKKNFRRSEMFNNFGNISTRGIQCNLRRYAENRFVMPWEHGDSIIKALKSVYFEGLTGPVAFDDYGYRDGFKLHVSTVGQKEGPRKVGEWRPEAGFIPSDRENNGYYINGSRRGGKVKIVSTILVAPFLQLKDTSKLENRELQGNDRYEGFTVDLAKILSERVGYQFILQEVNDGNFGIKTKGKWNGIIGELIRRDVDLAIAPLTITYEREKVVDFTKPFMDVGISIMIKKPEIEKPGVFSFMKPFSLEIWLCILLAYASISFGLFLVSRFSPYEWKKVTIGKSEEYENEFSLINSFWFSTGALMLQGSDSCPRSTSGRIIGTVWWFFVLIIISTYTANLAAFLTIERLVVPIESADDLAGQDEIKYGTILSGTTLSFFKSSEVPTYKTMWSYMKGNLENQDIMMKTIQDGIDRVRTSKNKYAFLIESTSNEYENSREPCDTMKVGRNLNNKGFGIATPSGSLLRDELNLVVLELHEDGTLLRLKQKWWQDKSQCAPDGSQESSGKRALSLSNVAGVFYILIGGLVIAVVFGAVEFTMKRLHLVPKQFYLRGKESSELKLIGTPSERENGNAVDCRDFTDNFGIVKNDPPEFDQPFIGFEGFMAERNGHTDV